MLENFRQRLEGTAMPVMKTGDVEIYYEDYGRGVPVLCFAPGSLRSHIDYWHCSPKEPTFMDPTVDLAGDFRIIVMDQRNAGRSRAPVRAADGWHTYAQDHVALMDHLGIERFHVLGACIGGSFCLKLCELVPARIMSAVILQPIGRVPENIAYTRRETAENWGLGMCTNSGVNMRSPIAMMSARSIVGLVLHMPRPQFSAVSRFV